MTRLLRLVGVAAATLAVAGCGAQHRAEPSQRTEPKLPRVLAAQLASTSDTIARKLDARDPCGALAAARTLRRRSIDAINSGRVPAGLQEPLLSGVSDLAGRIRCTPAPQPSVTPLPSPKKDGRGHADHGKHKGHEGDAGD